MSRDAEPPAYALGHSDRELARLAVQAELVDPITRRFLVEAGIASGMRVLDVGSGVGDVAFLAAELVGETGEVVGTDRSAAALAVARRRADERSLRQVTFVEGDPAALAFEQAFDAAVGRYVLAFQPDPAAMLRRVAGHVRAGGVVVFHESHLEAVLSYPAVPTYDRACALVEETFRTLGTDPLMGLKLHATFVAAGLAPPAMRLESVLAGGSTSGAQVHLVTDLLGTLVADMERLGVASAEGLDPETLADRAIAEAAATESVVVGRAEIGAWSRTAR